MTITAKFPGKCTACGGGIQVGASIQWRKGEGARHATCPTANSGKGKTYRDDAPCAYCHKIAPTRKQPCCEPCPESAVPGQLYEDCDRWHRACYSCIPSQGGSPRPRSATASAPKTKSDSPKSLPPEVQEALASVEQERADEEFRIQLRNLCYGLAAVAGMAMADKESE